MRSLTLWSLTISVALGAPVGVDGLLGPEWAGITPQTVLYNPSAPTSNFGSPTNESDAIGYSVYLRTDQDYVYGLLETNPAGGGTAVGPFANLYFDTNPNVSLGSDLGFEITNNQAFIPGVPGYYDMTGYLTYATGTTPASVEFAIPISFFLGDPLGIGFPSDTDGKLTLRLSQSFGFSVAGGPTYGPDRLGSVVIPEPSAVGLAAVAISALWSVRRRIKRA